MKVEGEKKGGNGEVVMKTMGGGEREVAGED